MKYFDLLTIGFDYLINRFTFINHIINLKYYLFLIGVAKSIFHIDHFILKIVNYNQCFLKALI